MNKKCDELNLIDSQADKKEEKMFQGYPIYPNGDNNYELLNLKLKQLIGTSSIEENESKEIVKDFRQYNSNNAIRRKALDDVPSKNDLDISGAELDDLLQKDIRWLD